MTIAKVQVLSNDTGAAGLTIAVSGTFGAGNGIYVVGSINDSFTYASISDNASTPNVYTQCGTVATGAPDGERFYHWYTLGPAAAGITGGAYSITLTANSAAADFKSIAVYELTGQANITPAFVATPNFQQPGPAGTDAVTSGNLTPAQQPGLLLGIVANVGGTNIATVGTGFTNDTPGGIWPTFGSAVLMESLRFTSTAAAAVTATRGAAEDYITTGIAFYEASAGGGGLSRSTRVGAKTILLPSGRINARPSLRQIAAVTRSRSSSRSVLPQL